MEKITQKQLNARIKAHEKWLETNGTDGKQLFVLLKDLTGLKFSNCNLSKARFISSILNNAIFENCKLDESDFSEGAKLQEAIFKNVEAFKADFSCWDMQKAKFENCNISNGKFINAKAYEVTFNGNFDFCDFWGADFNEAVMHGKFRYCHFYGTNFTDTNCEGAIFDTCDFSKTDFIRTNFYNATIQICDFTNAMQKDVKINPEMQFETY